MSFWCLIKHAHAKSRHYYLAIPLVLLVYMVIMNVQVTVSVAVEIPSCSPARAARLRKHSRILLKAYILIWLVSRS